MDRNMTFFYFRRSVSFIRRGQRSPKFLTKSSYWSRGVQRLKLWQKVHFYSRIHLHISADLCTKSFFKVTNMAVIEFKGVSKSEHFQKLISLIKPKSWHILLSKPNFYGVVVIFESIFKSKFVKTKLDAWTICVPAASNHIDAWKRLTNFLQVFWTLSSQNITLAATSSHIYAWKRLTNFL